MTKIFRTLAALLALAILITPALGGCGAYDDGSEESAEDYAEAEVGEVEQAQCQDCVTSNGNTVCTPAPPYPSPLPARCSDSCWSVWGNYYGALAGWAQTHCFGGEQTCPSGSYCQTGLKASLTQQCTPHVGPPTSACLECKPYGECIFNCKKGGAISGSCISNCKTNYPDCVPRS